jgi:predicted CXXCH cytochrome family protein
VLRAPRAIALWLAIGAAALCLARSPGDEPAGTQGVRVLFPADRAVIEPAKLPVIATMPAARGRYPPRPRLLVDGRPRKWLPLSPPVLLAHVQLTPGRHEVAIGKTMLTVYVRAGEKSSDEPRDWPLLRRHAIGDDWPRACSGCHEVDDRARLPVVGKLKQPNACLACHTEADFQLAHFHPLPPFGQCSLCHALHCSPNPSLLKAPAKTLCRKCHD